MSQKKEIRGKLTEIQQGLSPISGRELKGKRLETHHIREMYNGGDNSLDNLQALPISDHLAEHFRRSKNNMASEEEQLRELDIVLGRVDELTPGEKKELADIIFKLTGSRLRFM